MKKCVLSWVMILPIICLIGCATKKIDWQSRVGTYNYDQAVIELGPPDKTAKLSDGTTIAEWFQQEESRFSFGIGAGVSSGPVGVGAGVPLYGDRVKVLRLTFSPDGVLQAKANNGKSGEVLLEPAGSSRVRE